jgi:hypothetical protein
MLREGLDSMLFWSLSLSFYILAEPFTLTEEHDPDGSVHYYETSSFLSSARMVG